MYFERKELIQSLDLLCFILFVYTWLLDNRTLLLIVKAALQVQFCNPLQLHPTWSLPFFVVFLCCLNLVLALAHLWAPAALTNTGDAILIDFVGQSVVPGRMHMLLIDAFVCAVQLLQTVVAFECAKDQTKADGEPSELDDRTSVRDAHDVGQGWDVRDEEAALFGLDDDDERKRAHTSLTHHIAVVRLQPIFDQVVQRQFLPDPPNDDNQVGQDEASTTQQQPLGQAHGDRPDTSRIRRFSRRARAPAPSAPMPSGAEAATEAPYAGLGPVSADDSWPPMWLILARNTVGAPSSLPSLRPMQRLASLRDSLFGRFGRPLSHAPDRSQYTRVHTDAPLE